MQQQLEKRLQELKQEFETGQVRLQELVRQEQILRETLFRIGGAIQVIEEELAKAKSESSRSETSNDGQPG
jgi:septal ring factor EnvC (AmiA/AmiB activator)